MTHTPTPWRVFKTTDGRKLVGIGGQDGEGILDCGFGVWAWNDPEGIANAELVVRAVNSHDALVKALEFYANPEVYRPHPHGPAFDRRDLSDVAVRALASLRPAPTDCGGKK